MSSNEMQQPGDSYFEGHPTGYEEQIRKMHEEREKQSLEMERLCYEAFIANADGAKLYELFTERFIIPGLCQPKSDSFKQEVIYFEGFKEAFRGIYAMALNHQRRIQTYVSPQLNPQGHNQ